MILYDDRYESSDPRLRATAATEVRPVLASARPLGLFELSTGLASDRGPALSPAQLSLGKKLMGSDDAAGSQDSLPFAEEDASLVDSPGWDLSRSAAPARKAKQEHQRYRR